MFKNISSHLSRRFFSWKKAQAEESSDDCCPDGSASVPAASSADASGEKSSRVPADLRLVEEGQADVRLDEPLKENILGILSEAPKKDNGKFARQKSEMSHPDSIHDPFGVQDLFRDASGPFTVKYGIVYDCYNKLPHKHPEFFIPCEGDGKYGLCEDHSKTMVIPPVFEDVAFTYDEGGALIERMINIKVNGEWHLYKLGEGFIQHPDFRRIGHLHAGVYHVSYIGQLHGFIDADKRIALPFIYGDCKSFSEGLCAVKWIPDNEWDSNDGWGYIDREGNIVISGCFVDACKFHNGYARVRLKKEIEGGFYDRMAAELEEDIFMRHPELAGNWGVIDKRGKCIVPCSNSLAYVRGVLKSLRNPIPEVKAGRQEQFAADKNKIAIARDFVMVVDAGRRVIALDHDGLPIEYPVINTWHDIKAVAAGFDHGMAITEEGKVLSTGNSREFSHAIEVGRWRNITYLDACEGHTAAIDADGRILIVTQTSGYEHPDDYRAELMAIHHPVRLAVGWSHAAVLLPDGHVQAVGRDHCDSCCVSDWENVVDLDVFGCYYSPSQTVGLTRDGRVLFTDNYDEPRNWKDIVSISCGNAYLVALDRNGKVHAFGRNDLGQCEVEEWPEMICTKGDFFTTVAIDREGWIWMTPIGKTKVRITMP